MVYRKRATERVPIDRTTIFLPEYLMQCVRLYSVAKKVSISDVVAGDLEKRLREDEELLRILDSTPDLKKIKEQLLKGYSAKGPEN